MSKACAIIGDKPTRFKFGYKEDYSLCKKIKRVMLEQIKMLYNEGVTHFYVGGSLGAEMWAGEMILRLKEQPGYEEIELNVILPYEGHDSAWDERNRKRLQFLIRHSRESFVIGDRNCRESFTKRNYYMADHSEWVLAVCDNNISIPSGTGEMIHYAKRMKKRIISIHPDTATVDGGTSKP